MRAIAACQFTLSQFGAWRWAVLTLMGVVLLALLSWLIGQHGEFHWGAAVGLGLGALISLALGGSLLRNPAVCLRWDGQAWYAGPAASAVRKIPGDLSVAVDLGPWMLLRFQANEIGRPANVLWLPVQRKGLEAQWHTLRCAVYSPRPARDVARSSNAAADL
jgi:hypothetical protein